MTSIWLPMHEALKNGTPYLLKVKDHRSNDLLGEQWRLAERLGFKDNQYIFVGQNMRDAWSVPAGDYWQLAVPIGMGGFSDDHFEGFMELDSFQRCFDLLGDVPGTTLEDRLTRLLGYYTGLQAYVTDLRARSPQGG